MQTSNSLQVTAAQLRRAADIQERIEQLSSELRSILGGGAAPAPAAAPVQTRARAAGGRRGMSEEGRRRIAEAQRARWARARGESAPQSKPAPSGRPGRRTMSPEAKAKIAAAARLRWRRAKAAGRSRL